MHTLFNRAAAIVMAVLVPAAVNAQNRDATAPDASHRDTILEHIDEAEDIVESLLDWDYVLTAVEPPGADPKFARLSTTVIAIEHEPVTKLASVLEAISAMLPPADPASAEPRGDLRAHVEKAREIARELMPQPSSGTAGTSGAAGSAKDPTPAGDIIKVDRTAVERLEVEIDAIERLARRPQRGN
jgi:hypothetical protein